MKFTVYALISLVCFTAQAQLQCQDLFTQAFGSYYWRNELSYRVQSAHGMNDIFLTSIGIRFGLNEEANFAPRNAIEASRMGEILIQAFALKQNPSFAEAKELSGYLSRLGFPDPINNNPWPLAPYTHIADIYSSAKTNDLDHLLLWIGINQLAMLQMQNQLQTLKDQRQRGQLPISENLAAVKINGLIANIYHLRGQIVQLRQSMDDVLIRQR